MTIQELLDKADYYKNKIIEKSPFDSKQLAEVEQHFRVSFINSSNSIDGDTVTISEAEGYAKAFDYMLSKAREDKLFITEELIKNLHCLLYNKIDEQEAGHYRSIQTSISGTDQLPPSPEEIPHFMEHFINQMESSKGLLHPIEYAAICHKRFIDIYPFKDGNGRMARLLLNLILVNAGYGITSIPSALEKEYRNALTVSQSKTNPDIDRFILFITECVIESLRDYCRRLGMNDNE